jgi:hypothetical protein
MLVDVSLNSLFCRPFYEAPLTSFLTPGSLRCPGLLSDASPALKVEDHGAFGETPALSGSTDC